MNESKALTRPIRAAANATGRSEEELDGLIRSALVALRLENRAADNAAGRNIALAAANQILRFCPSLFLVGADAELVEAIRENGRRIHGQEHDVAVVAESDLDEYACVLNIGTDPPIGRRVTINSDGWLTRLAVGVEARIPWLGEARNAIGEIGAACRGVGEIFKLVIGLPPHEAMNELSLANYEWGVPGALGLGPPLPTHPLDLRAFLIGCGAVMNGWAYVVSQLPIEGKADAVDRQRLRPENLGPYVGSGHEWLGIPKAELIAHLLAPAIAVTPRADEFEFFKIRLSHELRVPPLIVGGLDNPETRRSVQHLWPGTLIDMAAGGWNSQVIVKQDGSRGQCLLDAFTPNPLGDDHADGASRETGIPAEVIRANPTGALTEEIVNQAPPAKRPALQEAKERGQLVCGRVIEHNLDEERDNPNFAAAVPFATGFSGVVAAAETMKILLGEAYEESFHYQHSFRSGRGRLLRTICRANCECQRRRAA